VPLFPSDEWIGAFCAQLERDHRAGAMAKALDGVYRFVIEPSGAVTERHSYDVSIVPDGDGASVEPLAGSAVEPRLTIAAPYPRWAQLLRGELDVPIAIMLRRIRVSGDLRAVTANLDDVRPLLDALVKVETEFM
jgi:hypothetical protein